MNDNPRPHRDRADWEQQYVEGELPWDSGEPDVHLGKVIARHRIKPGRALEIGCGTGTNAIWLAQQGFQVTGMDFSETAITMARAKVDAARVTCRLLVGDFLSDQVPAAPFDFVYDRGCFHVLASDEERSRFAARVAELLAPEGMWHSLIGSTDGPPRDTGPPRLSAAQVAVAVEPRFEILELRSTNFDRDLHNDVRAWVLVARRRTEGLFTQD